MKHYNTVLNMIGEGEEVLIDAVTGQPMAVFFYGNMQTVAVKDPAQSEIETQILEVA